MKRHVLGLMGIAALLSAILIFILLQSAALAQEGDGVKRATVVVQNLDQGAVVRAITFTAPLSGIAALQASGLDVVVAETSFGPAVCAIEGVGCPADNCFCGGDFFWNYNFWDGASWQSYPVGAGSSVISQSGAIEGWLWGPFGSTMLDVRQTTAALRGLDWLRSQQSPRDGGMGSIEATLETMMALGANGEAAHEWRAANGRRSLMDYAQIRQTRFSRNGAAAAGKLAVALAAAEGCWARYAVQPSTYFSDTLGAFSANAGFNAWGILGAIALSQTVPTTAVESLRASVTVSGGWEWQAGWGPDSNTTALAIQTLIAAGEPITSSLVISGLAFLKSTQQADGGFAYDAPGQWGSDANSTAYALQALVAAGEDPLSERWSNEGANPISYLLSLQNEDGAFAWQAGGEANLLATQQAIPALLGRPYPIAIRPVERCPGR